MRLAGTNTAPGTLVPFLVAAILSSVAASNGPLSEAVSGEADALTEKQAKISSDILRALSGVHPDRTDATGERTARGCLTWPLSDRRVLRVTTTRVPGGNVLRFEVTSAQGLTHGRPPVDPAPGDGRHDLTSDGPHMS